jgi:hypothetical protein
MAKPQKYDFQTLIEDIGGYEAVSALLAAAEYEVPPISTIRKWKERNSIATDWLATICSAFHVKFDRPFPLQDYRYLTEKQGRAKIVKDLRPRVKYEKGVGLFA